MKLTPEIAQHIKDYASTQFPNEACGVIVDGKFIPVANLSATPTETFEMHPHVWMDFKIQAVIHSHTNGRNYPSEDDMRFQISSGVPWGLVCAGPDGVVSDPWFWGKGVAELDYIGRVWRHGPSGTDGGGDCYALVLDYFAREFNIELMEMPRAFEWVENGDNFFEQNFEKAGFTRISESEVQENDCFLMAIRSNGVPNHCGVYRGNGLGLHHLINRVSRHEPLHGWRKFITHYLRYNAIKG